MSYALQCDICQKTVALNSSENGVRWKQPDGWIAASLPAQDRNASSDICGDCVKVIKRYVCQGTEIHEGA